MLLGTAAIGVDAQIRTDGTLGRPALTLAGPDFVIGEALGRLAGNNLFHSFQAFNVGSSESATFITTTPGLTNVISRVTGGTASQINGLVRLQSADAAPGFIFINPAGVVFGAGAQIDVPGAFHVATADYVRFPDGNFHADPAKTSTLSSAAPEAFGFLGATRATVALRDEAFLRTTSPGASQPIGIVAGDITLDNAVVETAGSDIRLIAVGARAQEVAFAGPLPDAYGNISIVNGAAVRSLPARDNNAGDLYAAAGNLQLVGTGLGLDRTRLASVAPDGATGNAGNVNLRITDALSITRGASIRSSTETKGNAGAVTVTAGAIVLDGRESAAPTGLISQANAGTGNAGSIDVTVGRSLSVFNGGVISSSTFAGGNAGTVTVTAGELTIDRKGGNVNTGIFSQANSGSAGNAGSVDVTTSGTLSIFNGGNISSSTFAKGNAGTVTVSAGDMTIDGKVGGLLTGIFNFASRGTGNAGSIDVTTRGSLSMVNGGIISSSTYAKGNAGKVTVVARDLTIDGNGGDLNTGITSQAVSGSAGNAGSVDVRVDGALAMVAGGAISSDTLGAGRAGSVAVRAEALSVDGAAFVGASAAAGTSGQTGTVDVQARSSINVSNHAALSIRNDATVADPRALTPTLLTVAAPSITLDSGGTITAASTGNVTASNVAVTFGTALTVSNAGISTSAVNGDGGAVRVNGSGVLTLQNGQITTSVTGVQGNGGDIDVTTPILVMQTGFIQANTTARNATGGRVAIDVDSLIPSGGTLFVGSSTPYTFTPDVFGYNVIQAAAPDGVSGSVRISTPVLDIAGSIAALPARYLDPGGPGRSPCAIAGGNSLAQVGRGGMLPRADAVLLTGTVLDDTGRSAATDLIASAGVPGLHGSAAPGAPYTIRCDSQSGPNAPSSPLPLADGKRY